MSKKRRRSKRADPLPDSDSERAVRQARGSSRGALPTGAQSNLDLALTLALLVVAAAMAIPGIGNQFTSDDAVLIQVRERLHGISHWREILLSPYWPPPSIPDLYRPVTSLFLALQYSIGGGDPLLFRIVSGVLYAIAASSLLRLESLIVSRRVALVIALIFAAHPVHVEVLALGVAQSELLVAIIAMASVTFYLNRRAVSVGSARSLSAREWALLAALYALAALSKENGLVLPGLLMAAELLLVADARSYRDRAASLWRGYAALFVVGILILAIRTAVLNGSIGAPQSADGIAAQGFAARVLTFLQMVPQIARLMLWPAHLRSDYGALEFVPSTAFGTQEAIGLIIIASTAALAWISRRRAAAVTFGLAWFAIGALPTSNLLAPTAILLAERGLFLPSIGFAIALGGAASLVVPEGIARSPRAWTLSAAAGVFVIMGVLRGVARQADWRDAQAVTLAGIRDEPASWRAQKAYGDLLFKSGSPAEATAAYHRAIESAPSKFDLRNQLAMQLRLVGNDEEAVTLFRESLEEQPNQIIPLAGIPPALIALGRYEEARSLADSIINAAGAPPLMVWLRHMADSALKAKLPPGSMRIGLSRPQ